MRRRRFGAAVLFLAAISLANGVFVLFELNKIPNANEFATMPMRILTVPLSEECLKDEEKLENYFIKRTFACSRALEIARSALRISGLVSLLLGLCLAFSGVVDLRRPGGSAT